MLEVKKEEVEEINFYYNLYNKKDAEIITNNR